MCATRIRGLQLASKKHFSLHITQLLSFPATHMRSAKLRGGRWENCVYKNSEALAASWTPGLVLTVPVLQKSIECVVIRVGHLKFSVIIHVLLVRIIVSRDIYPRKIDIRRGLFHTLARFANQCNKLWVNNSFLYKTKAIQLTRPEDK